MTEDPTAKAFAHITATVDKDLMKDYPNARQPATPEAVSATATTPAQEVTMVATATLKADQVRRNAFTENLGKDEFVAVDDLGNVIARSDRATLERDYPNAHFFGAKDLGGNAASVEAASVEAASVEAENAGRHAKTDELQAEQVKALEADGVFDHDGNGKPGGSKKGKDSTAAKGAERKRKPAAK